MANATGGTQSLKVASRIILPWQKLLKLHRSVKRPLYKWHIQTDIVHLYLGGMQSFQLERILLTDCLKCGGAKENGYLASLYLLVAELHEVTCLSNIWPDASIILALCAAWRSNFFFFQLSCFSKFSCY